MKKMRSLQIFSALMNERVTFFCINYIYTGKLVEVDEAVAVLEDAAIVFDTGEFSNKDWLDAQKLPHPCHVMVQSIESYMILK
jgi:hypothetical protein